ncbi:hypothetical protein BCR35DRAFT_306441 [Leucosporidium creatinivorum]|uniref:Uncharacterized protein n=1 Tax=Leucosporidium creatinivorum TaxID=106004 RepID=A0A1Y2EV53_9BASI|nr:hypothetical protein BCR35DRAFT_306441 [Leucosporidium creatinivorum]
MFRSTSARLQGLTRTYLCDVDIHGQLFLTSTKIRNFTSCFKDPTFLSFFYTHLRRNELEDEEAQELRGRGFEWISLCGRERSFLRPEDTPLVFQKLGKEGLTFAGSNTHPFDPTSLRSDLRGYLYHPSPPSPSLRRRSLSPSPSPSSPSPFGPYSLLRSSLVLEAFSKSLQIDEEGGGSFEWDGRRWEIGRLEEGQVVRRKGGEEEAQEVE